MEYTLLHLAHCFLLMVLSLFGFGILLVFRSYRSLKNTLRILLELYQSSVLRNVCVNVRLSSLHAAKNEKRISQKMEFSEPTFIVFPFQQQSTVDVANLILESYQKFGFITAETIDSMRNAQRLKVIQV